MLYNNILSSSDDEDIVNEVYRRPRVLNPRPDYFENYDDLEFFRRFRLEKTTVEHLLLEIQHELQHLTLRNHAISPKKQLLLTLRYYATGSHLIAISDFAGISKTSGHRIVHRVTRAIARLRPTYIKLPTTPAEITSTQMDFYEIARFPRVIAALDCTHIKIQSFGGNNAEVFRNRKGYFSINVQATCDAHLKITDIVARWPGGTHDSTILNNSRLQVRLEDNEFGDSGYGVKPYLITPLLDPQTNAERVFNESQIRTRCVIERTFGIWKRRFPCLATGMRFHQKNVLPVIVATAVLHNKARLAAEPLPPDDPTINLQWDEIINENLDNANGNRQQGNDISRINLINYFGNL